MIPSPSIRHLPAVLALLLGSALASSAQAVTYKAKDIGSVAPGQCYYNEMNAKGQIVGACYDAEGLNYTAYATDANGKNIHTIGLLSGSWSWTNGLNDNGVLVGDATIAGDLVSHAWIKQPSGAMTDLGTLGGDNSYALNVNNKGLIVGISEFDTLGSGVHGFVINPGSTTMIDVGNLGGTQMGVWEVNNKGVIGGFGSLAGDTEFRGFHAKPPYNKLIVMDTLGGTNSSVRGINDNGVIVGITRTAGGPGAPRLRRPGGQQGHHRAGHASRPQCRRLWHQQPGPDRWPGGPRHGQPLPGVCLYRGLHRPGGPEHRDHRVATGHRAAQCQRHQ